MAANDGRVPGPLAGMKVIESAAVVAGPYCGLMLADLGAEVIKLERYPVGDDSRNMVPPYQDGEAPPYLMLNRNKRGVVVDIRTTAGQEIFRRLARGTDVIVENYRKGVMDRLGIGYDDLRQDNPGLIYCAISGFGRTGPYAERGGYDLVAQGMSGLMSITGEGPGRPPVKVGGAITDWGAGLMATIGIISAYAYRLQTGEGQFVDTSLFEAGVAATFHQTAMTLASGISPGPMGSAHPLGAPYQAFRTADGWLNVGAGTQAMWPRLAKVLGVPELIDDPRFRTVADRMTNLDVLIAELEPLFKKHTVDEWLAIFEAEGIPGGPVLSIGEMLEDPQTVARDMVAEVPHSRLGKVKTLGTPVKFSATPTALRRGAPLLGEHTAEVLHELDYSDDDIAAFVEDGTVVVADG
jgi:crotonobetainyl-CoA:carnitine CoA-transferase CaiB-like acyl-CoA transferase